MPAVKKDNEPMKKDFEKARLRLAKKVKRINGMLSDNFLSINASIATPRLVHIFFHTESVAIRLRERVFTL